MGKLTWNDGMKPDAFKKRAKLDFELAGGLDALIAELMVLSRVVDNGNHDDEQEVPGIMEVRLQYQERKFALFAGDPSNDDDARGSWGASTVVGGMTHDDARAVADHLLDQVLDDQVLMQNGGGKRLP